MGLSAELLRLRKSGNASCVAVASVPDEGPNFASVLILLPPRVCVSKRGEYNYHN